MKKRTIIIVLVAAAVVIAVSLAMHREGSLLADLAAHIHGR